MIAYPKNSGMPNTPKISPIVLAITLCEPGGVTQFVLRFAEWLQNQGESVVILGGAGAWLDVEAQKRHIPFQRLRFLKRELSPVWDPIATLELYFVLRRLKPRAIHLNSSKMGAIGSVVARLLHIPRIVYRIGGWVFLEPMPAWKQSIYRWAERVTARWKDAIVCVHPGDQAIALREHIGKPEQLVVIPNGIHLPSYESSLLTRDEARKQLGLDSALFVFGTIAHAYPAKHLPWFVEHVATPFLETHTDAHYLLFGDGLPAERKKVDAALAHSLHRSRIHLIRDPGVSSRFLLAFDVFVLPSIKEGMPWSLLEAMAAGVACIASDVGACRWMLGPAGLICPPNDARAFLTSLERCFDKKQRTLYEKQGPSRVRALFPLTRTFEENARLLTKESK